jgi:hypothetical protein
MRSLPGKARVLTAGTLFAAALTGVVAMPAAEASTTTTKPNAEFWCDSTCNVPPVGYVTRGSVASDHGRDGDLRYPKIGSWTRTVDIQCKWFYPKRDSRQYRVTVNDTNWSGTFWVYAVFMTDDGRIDTSKIPDCGDDTPPPS